jgi:hypothetical protein
MCDVQRPWPTELLERPHPTQLLDTWWCLNLPDVRLRTGLAREKSLAFYCGTRMLAGQDLVCTALVLLKHLQETAAIAKTSTRNRQE